MSHQCSYFLLCVLLLVLLFVLLCVLLFIWQCRCVITWSFVNPTLPAEQWPLELEMHFNIAKKTMLLPFSISQQHSPRQSGPVPIGQRNCFVTCVFNTQAPCSLRFLAQVV
jgi:hypothetical protein